MYYTTEDNVRYTIAEEFDPSKTYYEVTSSITSLEDYFCNLRNLFEIDTKYIMLPLDEEPFDVDANSRTIRIPSTFRSSGIGVVGDEIAEMLFFRIDRFFDAQDFDTCDAYVQWENASGDQFITPITMKDLESQPGKIIYAWPISSKVTKESGTIKFSLRIVKFKEDQVTIAYSFSTLTASVSINSGLNYNISGEFAVNQDNPNVLFENSIENSENTVGPSAAVPVWIEDLTTPIKLVKSQEGNKWTVKLRAAAGVSDTGVLTYKWYHRKNDESGRTYLGLEGVGTESTKNHMMPKVEMVKVEPGAQYNELSRYYTKGEGEDNDLKAYTQYDGGKEGFDAAIEDPGLYERYTTLEISGDKNQDEVGYVKLTGQYSIEATNKLGTRSVHKDSTVAFMNGPSKLTVDVEEGQNVFIEEKGADLTLVTTQDPDATLSYEWYSATTQDGDFTTKVQKEDSSGPETGATLHMSAEKGTPAYYKAKVTSMVNLDTIHQDSPIVKVMKAPVAPEFVYPPAAEDGQGPTVKPSVGQITVVLKNAEQYNNPLVSERLEYHWYIESDLENEGLEEFDVQDNNPSFTIPAKYHGAVQCKVINYLADRKAESAMSTPITVGYD